MKIIFKYFLLLFVLLIQSNDTLAGTISQSENDTNYQYILDLSYVNPQQSLQLIDQNLKQAKSKNNTLLIAKYHNLKGKILLNATQKEEALENLVLAQSNANKNGSQDLKLEVEINFLEFYIAIEDLNTAEKYYNRIKNKCEQAGINKHLLAKAYNALGNYKINIFYSEENLNAKKNLETAFFYYNKSLTIAKTLNDKRLISVSLINLGACNYSKERYDKAITNFRQALDFCILLADTYNIAAIKANLGSLYFDIGDFSSSITMYKESIMLFQQIKALRSIPANSFFMLSESFEKTGNYKEALINHKIGMRISDSIYYSEKGKLINELATKYETEKIEFEAQKNKINLLKSESKNQYRKITIISLLVLITFIITILLFKIRANKLKETILSKELEIKNNEINTLLKDQELKSFSAMLEGQDQERQRIGNDLHDRLGGLLSTVKMYFQTIEDKINRLEENTIAQFNKADELLNDAVNEVRLISHNLSSGVLKNFGLPVALEDLKQTIELSGEIKVNLFISGEKRPLGVKTELEIYRIIQELFSNTLKHAKAQRVEIQFNYFANKLNIIFEDDGQGFDLNTAVKGLGLKNIEARTNNLNGELNIDTLIGRGSIFIIDIPIL